MPRRCPPQRAFWGKCGEIRRRSLQRCPPATQGVGRCCREMLQRCRALRALQEAKPGAKKRTDDAEGRAVRAPEEIKYSQQAGAVPRRRGKPQIAAAAAAGPAGWRLDPGKGAGWGEGGKKCEERGCSFSTRGGSWGKVSLRRRRTARHARAERTGIRRWGRDQKNPKAHRWCCPGRKKTKELKLQSEQEHIAVCPCSSSKPKYNLKSSSCDEQRALSPKSRRAGTAETL